MLLGDVWHLVWRVEHKTQQESEKLQRQELLKTDASLNF